MDINELNERFSQVLNETLEDEAKSIVLDYISELHDVIEYSDFEQIASDLAEQIGCITYGDDGKDYLVKNVKLRPQIDFEAAGLDWDNEEHGKIVQNEIEHFADELYAEDNNFIILGRMGGYWGYGPDCVSEITLSDQGIDELIYKLVEKAKDEYNHEIGAPELAETMANYYDDLFVELLEDTYNFKFNDELKNKMLNLIKQIDDKEAQMNTKEYWEDLIKE